MIPTAKCFLILAALTAAVTGIALGTRKHEPTTLELVKDYTKWKKANPKPVLLSTSLDLLCRGVMPEEREYYQKENPHFDRYITVYVNPIGETAMMKGGEFPVGSIIVKEKQPGGSVLLKPGGPMLLNTVMIKRAKGYNPACGDWQFAAIDGFTAKLNGDGKLESCMFCHKDQAKQDFVYRTYIGANERWSPSGFDPTGWNWSKRFGITAK